MWARAQPIPRLVRAAVRDDLHGRARRARRSRRHDDRRCRSAARCDARCARSSRCRRSGSRSTRILRISVTPFERSRRSAITQYGHTPVAYMETSRIHFFSSGRLACCHAPDAALQVDRFLEAVLLEQAYRRTGPIAARTGDHDRPLLELFELLHAGCELGEGNVLRIRKVTGGILARLAHVENHRIPAIDELVASSVPTSPPPCIV